MQGRRSSGSNDVWSLVAVADADAVLQDLRHALRTGSPGNVGLLACSVGVVMSQTTITEVDNRIEKVAAHPPFVDALAMRRLWEGYKNGVEVHQMAPADVDSEQARRLHDRDPKDLPVLAAATSRGNAVILTNDSDLIDLGLAPESWLTTTRALLPIVQGDATVQAGTTIAYCTVIALGSLGRRAVDGSAAARVASLLLVVATAYALGDGARRARTAAGFRRAVVAFRDVVTKRQECLGQLRPYVVATIVGPDAGTLPWAAT